MSDNINKPAHYRSDCDVSVGDKRVTVSIECNDVINALELNFNCGNVQKYIWRAGKKIGNTYLQDLKKARRYLDMEIRRIERPHTGEDAFAHLLTGSHRVSPEELKDGRRISKVEIMDEAGL